jgi:hypothetical protein
MHSEAASLRSEHLEAVVAEVRLRWATGLSGAVNRPRPNRNQWRHNMQTQSRKLMLASGIALASIGGLATGAASAAAATTSLPSIINLLPILNILPNLTLNIAPNVAPTTALSPTITAPVLGASTLALPGLGAL